MKVDQLSEQFNISKSFARSMMKHGAETPDEYRKMRRKWKRTLGIKQAPVKKLETNTQTKQKRR